jgi:hypothetical protein
LPTLLSYYPRALLLFFLLLFLLLLLLLLLLILVLPPIPLHQPHCRQTARLLLQHMGQLVGDQLLAVAAAGIVDAEPEKHIAPHGKSLGLNSSIELARHSVRVDPDPAEIGAELCLEILSEPVRKRLAPPARRAQLLLKGSACLEGAADRRRGLRLGHDIAGLCLIFQFSSLRDRRPRHLFGDSIRLLLTFVARHVHGEFRLDEGAGREELVQQRFSGAVAKSLLEAQDVG